MGEKPKAEELSSGHSIPFKITTPLSKELPENQAGELPLLTTPLLPLLHQGSGKSGQ